MSEPAIRDAWAKFYQSAAAQDTELRWPSETLVRLFMGGYAPGLVRDYPGRRVLDVGFGDGNNLLFLGSLGLRLAGTEVDDRVCASVREKLARVGLEADLQVGTNQHLPFESGMFDFLVSWNVLHYEPDEAAIELGLAEYQRVLKRGGRLFLSTTGPEHKILAGSRKAGSHRYEITRDDDFRKGRVLFAFETADYVQESLGRWFSGVLVGRTHHVLLTKTLDWFIATGVKG